MPIEVNKYVKLVVPSVSLNILSVIYLSVCRVCDSYLCVFHGVPLDPTHSLLFLQMSPLKSKEKKKYVRLEAAGTQVTLTCDLTLTHDLT